MKKIVCVLCMILLVFSVAFAEDLSVESFDVNQYSYDELSELDRVISERMREMERQYAIEHGDRIIDLGCEELTMYVGLAQKMTPSVKRVTEDAPEKTSFVWTSSDPAIAKVSTEGKITAVSAGEAVITCTAKDNEYIFSTVAIHSVLPAKKINISEQSVTLLITDDDFSSMKLEASVEPTDAYCKDVDWTTSDENVVTVAEDGSITAVSPGKATITAVSKQDYKSSNGAVKATCKVVVNRAVSSIQLNSTSLSIDKGKTSKLQASVFPENASVKKVSWSSSDPSVAKVDASGNISAKSCGQCVITCKAEDGSDVSASCSIQVIQMVNKLQLSDKKITLGVGNSYSVSCSVAPEDATKKSVIWSSSDTSIATVKGKTSGAQITAVSGGTCDIICKTADGSEVSQKIQVYVPSFSLKSDSYTVTSKDGLTISASYYGKKEALSYEVSTEQYCLVSGKYTTSTSPTYVYLTVTPKKAGKTTITLYDANDKKSTTKITVEVAHSAVYDNTSYPKASYKDIMRYPSEFKNEKVHIYGKVLQKLTDGTTGYLRVGTSGYGYYDSIFYVTYSIDDSVSIIEDDYITIYGTCTGTYTYTALLFNEITIPSMTAEKIFIGKN